MGLSNNLHLTFIGRPWGSIERKSWSRICIDPCHPVSKNMTSGAEKVDFRAPSLLVAEPQIATRAGEGTMTHQMQQKAWQKKTLKHLGFWPRMCAWAKCPLLTALDKRDRSTFKRQLVERRTLTGVFLWRQQGSPLHRHPRWSFH